MPVGPPFEFGAVSWPARQKRRFPFAVLFFRQTTNRFETDPSGVAVACRGAVMLNPRLQMLDQFIRCHLNPKSIDHSPPRP
jgi:hypothetical protein